MLKVVVVNLRGDESLALMDILIWLKVLLQVQQFEVLIATLIFKKKKHESKCLWASVQCHKASQYVVQTNSISSSRSFEFAYFCTF